MIGWDMPDDSWEDESITIDGHVDESLSKGLRSRFERSNDSDFYAAIEAAGKSPNNAKAFNRWGEKVAKIYFGDLIARMYRDKQRTRIIGLSADPEDGLYCLQVIDIRYRNARSLRRRYFRCGISKHAAERYFERVRGPFCFRDLAYTAMLSLDMAIDGAFDEDGNARMSFDSGQMLYRKVERSGEPWIIATTFLSPREMTDREYANWQKELDEFLATAQALLANPA